MKKLFLSAFIFSSLFMFSQKKYVLVIHGGAGTITKDQMTPEKEKAYKASKRNVSSNGSIYVI